jgi:chemotaxis protein MotA
MLVIIGYIVLSVSIIGGFMGGGGHPGVLLQPFEFVIIIGAAIGAFVCGNSMPVIKAAISQGTATLKSTKYNKEYYIELLMCFYAITTKTRKEGLLSLESIIDDPKSSPVFTTRILGDHHLLEFICDNLRLIVTGVEVYALEELMDQELEVHHEESYAPVKAVQNIADGLPAFGIVAAVMGVVHTMESVGIPPSELGKLIAAALVGTFLGILLAYGFIGPVSSVMAERSEAAGSAFKCAQKGLLCCAKGVSPAMTAEYMRTMIVSALRPGFMELEELLRANKG